jgi:hypothetical protein
MSRGTWLTPEQKADKALMAERRRLNVLKRRAQIAAERAAGKQITRQRRELKNGEYSVNNCRPILKGDLILIPQVAGLYNTEYPALCMGCGCNLNKYNLGPVFNDVPLHSRRETKSTIKILCNRCYRAYPALPGTSTSTSTSPHQQRQAGHAV